MRLDTLSIVINVLVQSAPEEQQSFYRVTDDQPISDHSLLPEALQSACAGLLLHWMEPVSALDAMLQSGTRVNYVKKNCVLTMCCTYIICLFPAFLVSLR